MVVNFVSDTSFRYLLSVKRSELTNLTMWSVRCPEDRVSILGGL